MCVDLSKEVKLVPCVLSTALLSRGMEKTYEDHPTKLLRISSGTPDDVLALHDRGDQQMLRFFFWFSSCQAVVSNFRQWNHVLHVRHLECQ